MDFAYTEEQNDLRELVAKIFTDLVPGDKLPDFEEPTDWFDDKLWSELASAGLLGIALPESVGGSDMGFTELCILLEEAGRVVAPAPLIPTLVLGALPIAEFGTEEQKAALLPDVTAGKTILTAALADENSRDPLAPSTLATRSSDGWKLNGVKAYVPIASRAKIILVSARTDDGGTLIALVEPDASGLHMEAQETTTGELEYRLTLSDVSVANSDILGEKVDDGQMLAWLVARATTALCATELGLAAKALQMTAKYTSERKQFDKPIASFQAVAQRAGDAFIDLESLKLATMQAVWRLSNGLPADREISIAKFWAAEGGHRICYAAQHLHGGIGVDTDYPLHHYYLRSRQIELTLGGTNTHLAALGDRLAEHGPTAR